MFFEFRGLSVQNFDVFPLLCNASVASFIIEDVDWKIIAHRNGASIEYRGALSASDVKEFIDVNWQQLVSECPNEYPEKTSTTDANDYLQ